MRVTCAIIAEHGFPGVTFREIGKRMGGSTTLVTHYYRNQVEVLEALAETLVESWSESARQLARIHEDSRELLHALVFEWLLPLEGDGLVNEQARINFVAAGLQGIGTTRQALDLFEDNMRDTLRAPLSALLSADDVEHAVDVIRVTFNGLALSCVEHPGRWSADRQTKVMSTMLSALGLPAR